MDTIDSEEKSPLLREAAFEAVIILEDGRIVEANRPFSELLGYGLDEARGLGIEDILTGAPGALATNAAVGPVSATFRHRDGTTFPGELRAKRISSGGRDFDAVSIKGAGACSPAEEALLEIDNRLIQLVEGLPLAVLLVDRDGSPRYANAVAEELLGASVKGVGPEARAGLLSEVFNVYVAGTDDLYPHERFPTVRALAGERPTFDDLEIARPEGRIPIEVSAAPILDDTGEIAYAVAVFKDITERRRVQESLRQAEEKYRAIVENAVDGIFQSTPGGRFITVNPALVDIWGYDSAEEMMESITDISERYADPGRRRQFKELLEESGVVRSFEAQVRRKDGTLMWMSVSARSVRDSSGGVLYYEGTLEDITERREAEEALRENEDELQKINAELEGYAHTVSHDLNGPLSAISVASLTLESLLISPQPVDAGEDVKEIVAIIGANSRKASDLVGDLLTLAEAGQQPGDVSDVDVSGIVREVLEERAGLLKSRNARVEVDGDLGRLQANPTRVYQVFSNLVTNAIQHNDTDEPLVEVRLLGEVPGGGYRYLVRDNGPGIPGGAARKIFHPFFKGTSGRTGIGLSIVEKVVNACGGEIRAYNDGGACFEFTLKSVQ